MTDEKLIEEAAKAIALLRGDVRAGEQDRISARAAFAVFEKAHAPTDDERDDLAHLIRNAESDGPIFASTLADVILAAGFRRPEVPKPQGEPTDAQVRAAIDAWHRTEGSGHADWYQNPINRDRMSAALRAAGEVKR